MGAATTQQQYDTSTGLYYYGARYYDPVSGRFITEDKASGNHATPASLNRYTYAYNSPARYIDPTGNTATEANPGLSGTGAVSSSLNSGEPEVIGAAGGLLTRMPPSKTGWVRLTYQDRTGRTYEGVADSDIVMFVGPVSQPPTFYATAPAMAGSYGWVPTEMEYAIIRQQLPRIVSGVQAIAGASEIYGGGSLALAGGSAIAACIASGACAVAAFVGGGAAVLMGTFGVANGVDDVQAGIRGAYSNSYEASFKHRYSYAVARAAGASRERADLIATGIEIGVGFGAGFGSAAAAGALRSATNLERLAAQGVRHLDNAASADARLASQAAGMADDAARTAETASGRIAAAPDIRVPGMSGVSARHQAYLLEKHADIIAQLESNAFVHMPQGTASASLMGEITAATGREVGLWRLTNGRRVMNIGTSNSVAAHPSTYRLIAHTHPNGLLWLSNNPIKNPVTGAVTGFSGDVPLLKWLATHGRAPQRSTLLIGPTPASPSGASVPWFTVRPGVPQ